MQKSTISALTNVAVVAVKCRAGIARNFEKGAE